jgi:hypothetical protein
MTESGLSRARTSTTAAAEPAERCLGMARGATALLRIG